MKAYLNSMLLLVPMPLERRDYTIFLYLRHNECKLGKHSSVDVCHGFRNLVLEFPPVCPYGIEDILNRSLHLSERVRGIF